MSWVLARLHSSGQPCARLQAVLPQWQSSSSAMRQALQRAGLHTEPHITQASTPGWSNETVQQAPILISGAGPSGLTLALLLSRYGVCSMHICVSVRASATGVMDFSV